MQGTSVMTDTESNGQAAEGHQSAPRVDYERATLAAHGLAARAANPGAQED